jgi:CubicO group peptidase (beta-lactamase class C family)
MKTFIQTLFFFFLVTQISFAQFEFSDSYLHTKISKGQITNSYYGTLNSSILDSIITDYITSEHIPGATGLIFNEDGDVLWSGNYGYKNLQNQLPVEDSTYFLMASISKTFIATAIMQLWEKGIINLDASINDYLPSGFVVVNPYFPSETITVKMLMLHTSSLKDNWDILFDLWACGDYPVSVDSFLVNYFTPGGTYYSSNNFYGNHPGNYWNYSNAGVCLLALMIKNLTGKNFDEYTRDSILTPLSMNSSSWYLDGMDTSKIATPYRGTGNTPQAMCHIGFAYWPVVQLRTNKLELANFAAAYLHNGIYKNYRLLDSTTIALMLSNYVTVSWGYQGLIWGAAPSLIYNMVWGHDGAFAGTQTGMFICTEENWGIIFFINRGEPPNFSSGFFPVLKQMANYAHLITDIKNTEQLPIEISLLQNYPNPFNPSTSIQYAISSRQFVKLTVYDLLGREIETLVNEEKPSGTYEITWYAENLPSGVYFYQLKAGSFIETKKMLLLK